MTEITVKEAAHKTGYTESHIRWLAAEDKMASRRIGERVLLIDEEGVLAYAEKMRKLGNQKFAGGG